MKTTKANQIKRRYLFALLILMGGGSQTVWALDCTPKTGALTINVGNIIVQKDTANLTALTPEITSTGSGYDCKYDGSNMYVGVKAYGTYTGNRPVSAKIFASNVAGVGVAVGATSTAPLYFSAWVGSIVGHDGGGWSGEDWVLTAGSPPQNYSFSMTSVVQLYKTGILENGVLSGKIGALIVENGASPIVRGTEIPIYITGTVTKIACSLNSTSINVPLGDISATQFTGIASTAGDKGFNVGLSCDKEAKINVALAGTQNSDTSDTSVLALTNTGQTGTATGVGVQLLYGGVPLKINNNILLKTSPGGQETLPFTARYYQTQATVGAGLANSSATLNITYQ